MLQVEHFFFQAEDGIRDGHVTGVQTVIFRSLGGVSLGIALKSVYRFQTEEGGPYYEEPVSESEATEKGEEIATNPASDERESEGVESGSAPCRPTEARHVARGLPTGPSGPQRRLQ